MKEENPICGCRFTKGIGFWAGLNFTYGNLCIWLPFLQIYITLPKYFKKGCKCITVDKKYFWYSLHPASFGFYFDFQYCYGLRIPFLDIYLKDRSKDVV